MELKASSTYFTFILLWYSCGIFHLALFLYDFFPVKNKLVGTLLKPPQNINGISLNSSNNYQPEFDRVVMIVIDALRRDFVSKSNMPYVYTEISKEQACLMTTKAESPTVTMPRIKAMTTGSVSQFVDLVLNFASTEIKEDSFLHRAKHSGKKMIFYGDDTWLKLFPRMFLRSKGTTSFYVTDFTEVDNNVTRHLKKELEEKNDWDILFMHYLGLDHIGHVHGSFHPLIKTKLEEMDTIIRKIHTTLKKQGGRSLVVVCGDHGMRDSGGHGGSTEKETLVPLVFLNFRCDKKFKSNHISAQIDLAPTLSALMGLPLPADNIGRILPEITSSFSVPRHLYLLHYNALNLIEKNYEKYISGFTDLFQRHSEYILSRKVSSIYLIKEYERKITDLTNSLIKSSTIQHISFLYLTFGALPIILICVLILPRRKNYVIIYCPTLFLTILTLFFRENPFLSQLSALYFIFQFGTILWILPKEKSVLLDLFSSPLLFFLVGGTVMRTILLFSTSYIEREHLTWFFLWGSATILGAYEEFKGKTKRSWINIGLWLLLFCGLRLFRHLHHIEFWDTTPDIGNWLQRTENGMTSAVVFLISLIGVTYSSGPFYAEDQSIKTLMLLTNIATFWYRISLQFNSKTVTEARIAILLIILTTIRAYVKLNNVFKTLTLTWILWISLLMKPHNVILIPSCVLASRILFQVCYDTKCLVILHIWLAQILFHCQGFCNSLASVDVSPGYVGLSEYSLALTSLLVICHAYAFQTLSVLLLCSNLDKNYRVKMWHTVVMFRLSSVTFCCFVILIHRQHLFIWSVFSPKIIIESCHGASLLIGLVLYFFIDNVCTRRKESLNIP